MGSDLHLRIRLPGLTVRMIVYIVGWVIALAVGGLLEADFLYEAF